MRRYSTGVFSIDDFRCLPEVKPSLEFFGGRVIQKLPGDLPHSILQSDLMFLLHGWAKTARLGQVYPELRCTFGHESHVFDLCWFVRDRLPNPTNPLDRVEITRPPDLAIEILSPRQTVGELSRKLRSAIRRGVRIGWLIDEVRRTVHVFHTASKSQVLRTGDVLSGEDVLSGFTLAIEELFGWLESG